jgi:multidrug efflux pump
VILSDAAIRNRTTVGVLTAVILLMGVWSYLTLPRENTPDIPIPIIVVTTAYEGVAPADIETSVTMKIETEMAGLKGLKEVRSSSAEGISIITIEFLPDISLDDALQRVRDKVELAKAEMPTDIEEPTLTEVNLAEFPIMVVNISGDISPIRLKAIADRLEDQLELIPGVLNVDVLGALEREIRLEVDQDKLAAYGLTIPEIVGLIPAENVNISAGGLQTPGTRFNVRVPAEFVNPDEVDGLVIAVRNGRPINLTEIATVRDTFKDRSSYSRLDGQPSLTVTIQKRIGENILPIAEAVRYVLDEFRQRVPDGVTFEITLDQSDDVRMMVKDLENNLLSGMILVVAVLVIFMGWRASMIVALAIPMSMLLSFAVVQLLGFTLNMVVLFSLIMALGMLVDNAIVIVENIYRHYGEGGSRIKAAMTGTSEVAWPVITSTATTLAAFAPLLFWPGIMGSFMSWLPKTLIITLISSLFVALVINPTISSAVVTRANNSSLKRREHWLIRGYRQVLRVVLGYRLTTLTLSLLLLVGFGAAYGRWGAGQELFPDIDPRRAIIDIRAPQGTNIESTNALSLDIENRLDLIEDDLERNIASVGSAGESAGDHLASITLIFDRYENRRRASADAIHEMRDAIADIAGAEVKIDKQEEGPPTGDPVSLQIIGEDFAILRELSKQIRAEIEAVPNLVNLRSDLEDTRPELAFRIDRERAMRLGVNTRLVGDFLKTAIFGREVGKYRQLNDEYDITVRLPQTQRNNFDELFRLHVPNLEGQAIPLSSIGEFEYVGGLGTIRRVDQKRVVTLGADAEGRLATEVLADVQKRVSKIELPLGYTVRYAGQAEEQDEAMAFLSRSFVIALAMIVLIMVMQFNTLIVPLLIMTTVILSLIGVLIGLLITHMPFGIIMTGVGVISLAGVVVNNAIVLLDYTRLLERRGMPLVEAAIQAGATRLRPVLLTAVTTILGLLPMAIGTSFDFRAMEIAWKSESSQWWRSMAIAVIFGLAFATLLTLVVLPVLYVALSKLTRGDRPLSDLDVNNTV